ncbi:radical SAM protein [Candidatus Clostridium stratigraminis]|uniref:Radical SAM protein n=1 Tax=Candidatus Clostridium stratigraminis TaxID=3381661 RepID=A0ABW8T9F3_9CLOT
MHYTLHLTNGCNMNCSYCYVNNENLKTMSIETARKAVNMASKGKNRPTGIVFFGGEPLLCKNLIYDIIEYCRWKEKIGEGAFYFKITTNGILLDEAFIELSLKEDIFIALSHDGIREAHDKHRIDNYGRETFSVLSDKVELLLSKRPYAPVMMVVNPDTANYFYNGVLYLYKKGFRYIIISLNYEAHWTEKNMKELKKQYERLAEFYLDRTMKEDKFYLSPFEVKISSFVNGDNYCHERCELGKKQISVAPDGFLYPCVQFVGEKEYCIGNVDVGIILSKQAKLHELNEEEKESCKNCAIKERCNHYCGCMNKQATGSINKVSPVQCRHERFLIPIADKLAERLYKKRNALFIQKHYNEMFPIISMIEDRTAAK